jgi:excisionase family DNA binding protein
MPQYDGEKLPSPAQVAEMLGVQTVTVRAWLGRRMPASVKVGKRAVRIPLSEIAKLVERGYTPARREREVRHAK